MLLTIDVGNSNIVIAVFEDNDMLESWRLHTDTNQTSDDWWLTVKALLENAALDPTDLEAAVLGSVAPRVGNAFSSMIVRYLNIQPLIVNARLPLKVDYKVDNPDEIGADRICNVVAARHLYDCPAVVIDLGTATTFDIIDAGGDFIGGVIAPGMETSAHYLISKAALLSAIEMKAPGTVIGKDSESNLQAGIVYGAVDQIDGILERIQAETGWEQMTVVITGGLARLLMAELRFEVLHDPDLTVKGLKLIYDLCG